MIDDECGGDPPCWAHVFEDADNSPSEATAVNLPRLAGELAGRGAVWTRQSDDLNLNLLNFSEGEGVQEHVNREVDVLLIGVAGAGIVTVDGEPRPIREGMLLLVPKGARRSTRALSERFAYLTCHRKRAGLWPTVG